MNMISASHITYYLLCHRKLWLHHRGMRMEDNSQAVAAGKLLGRTAYRRRSSRWKELNLGHLKIDHFDTATNTVREVKKSPKLEYAHLAQVRYYMYHLEQLGLQNVSGLIEYPKQRKTTQVVLSDAHRKEIKGWEMDIERIVELEVCPDLVRKGYCRHCAFRDFCFI